jgi:predicted phosphodiesterase
MMTRLRLQAVSDLHLEIPASGRTLALENVGGRTDLLILAGDICVAREAETFKPFFQHCAETFPRVVYIAGNHESYRGDIEKTDAKLRGLCAPLGITYLQNETLDLGSHFLFAGTLWTDCNGGDPITKAALCQGMNDYRFISWESRQHWKLCPNDTEELHRITLSALGRALVAASAEKPLIVVTHHAPSRQSIHPRYHTDHLLNGGYQSDLEWIMLANPDRLPLWIHGHTHDSFDYTVGGTRIVCNPRGYVTSLVSNAENPDFDPNKVIEV